MAGLVLLPSQNSYISNNKPESNFSNSSVLYSGINAKGFIFRSLLLFDLILLPQDTLLESAVLSLYTDLGGVKNDAGFFTPYIITSSWNQNEVTWNNQPEINASIAGETKEIIKSGLCSWDIKSIVQVWILNSSKNFGLMLKSSENAAGDIKRFHSLTDYYYKNYRPFIEIRYSHRNQVSIGSRTTTSTIEVSKTSDECKFSSWQTTAAYSTYTFFVQNLGQNPVCVHLQISPDKEAIKNESFVINIPPGNVEALVPQKFGFFTRVAFKSSFSGRSTNLKIWFQAQV